MNRVPSRTLFLRIAAVFLIFGLLAGAAAQAQDDKKKKKKKNDTSAADSSGTIIPLSDEQRIDYLISEVLGAWQIGDTERMHKDYADDVSVVKATWEAPILGWSNYEAMYKLQRTTMQQVRLDRGNTYIKVNGATAWACFQWEFSAVVNGTPSGARGQTTYVFIKKDNRWLIAHDHTSIVHSVQQTAPNAAPVAPAASPKPGS